MVKRWIKVMILLLVLTLLLRPIVRRLNYTGERSLPTSVVGMEFLLQTEHQLLSAMEGYANKLESNLRIMRSIITEIRAEYLKSQINQEEYLSNPINSYALIRRLHEDWNKWELFLRSFEDADDINKIKELSSNRPTSADLMEASEAIYRINAVYNISPIDMAAGLINGKQYDARFSAIDCFSIGYLMFKNSLYYLSGAWLYTSLQLYEDSDINAVLEFDKIKIVELYAEVFLKQNFLNEALATVNSALNVSPRKAKLLQLKSEIEQKIKTPTETVAETTEQDNFHVTQADILRDDCRHLTNHSKLHCLYNKITTAFLQLAPIKMEILNLDPYVVLYHDVISDVEIADIKNKTGNKLAITYPKYGESSTYFDKGRTVKSHWLVGKTNTIEQIQQRITDMSGLDTRDVEDIEILNYGIGGHLTAHYDFFNLTEVSERGDRIATVLFYMSDVDQGGGTVFPFIELIVRPKKGAALMFYNLNNKGKGDSRTFHGSCPVIVGSKWAMALWIPQYSQMFRRPCIA